VAGAAPAVAESLAGAIAGRGRVRGTEGRTYRIGRAVSLRGLPKPSLQSERRALRHKGPYLPIIIEACQEQQLSYEYRDGATSYGAFTFSLAKVLRETRGGVAIRTSRRCGDDRGSAGCARLRSDSGPCGPEERPRPADSVDQAAGATEESAVAEESLGWAAGLTPSPPRPKTHSGSVSHDQDRERQIRRP
jgi:hypothetical protein